LSLGEMAQPANRQSEVQQPVIHKFHIPALTLPAAFHI